MSRYVQTFDRYCKYSVHLISTLLKPLWQCLQPRVYKLGTPVFGEILPFFSTYSLKLCQVGWGALRHSYFQVVVLLEGEIPPQSEVLSALEQVFIKDLSVLCYVHLSLDPD